MAEIEFHAEAIVEYRDAKRWYLQRSLRAAAKFDSEVEKTLNQITQSPSSFPPLDDKYRFAVLRRYPYSVIFEILEVNIFVLAVAHASRDIDYWRSRE